MKIKMFLKRVSSAAMMSVLGLIFSAKKAMAVVGVQLDNSGNFGATYASNNSAFNSMTNGGYGGWSLTNPYGLPSGSILGILSNLLYWLLAVFAIAGIIGFVLSGIYYLMAGADEGNAKKGKSGMTASIIGIIVGLSGFIIMQAVAALLGGGNKTF